MKRDAVASALHFSTMYIQETRGREIANGNRKQGRCVESRYSKQFDLLYTIETMSKKLSEDV